MSILWFVVMCGVFCAPMMGVGIVWYVVHRYAKRNRTPFLKATSYGLAATWFILCAVLGWFVYQLIATQGNIQVAAFGGAMMLGGSGLAAAVTFPLVWALSMMCLLLNNRSSSTVPHAHRYIGVALAVLVIVGGLVGLQIYALNMQSLASKTTDESLLQRLSRHPFEPVKEQVASNRHTPGDVLRFLAQIRSHGPIVSRVASNPHSPPDLLAWLAWQQQTGLDALNVRQSLAQNPSTPLSVLRELSHSYDSRIRSTVAGNRSVPEDWLEGLAKDPDRSVRHWVIFNPSVSETILTQLTSDADDIVRFRASEALENRRRSK